MKPACYTARQTEEEEGDHSRYLASHREQESPEGESYGHQIKEAEREIPAAVSRSRLDIEEDDKGRQAGLNGRPGKSSSRDRQQGTTRRGVQDHQAGQRQVARSH